MRKTVAAVVLGAAMLAGCMRGGAEAPPTGGPIAIERESITYETGPCFGACPIYSVTVSPDGTGVFTGRNFTAVTGERRFTLTRAQYDAFARLLAPYRPASGEVRYTPGAPNCRDAATDMPSAQITWTRPIGDSQRLDFYFGCFDAANAAIRDAVGKAPELLPIQALIGERP